MKFRDKAIQELRESAELKIRCTEVLPDAIARAAEMLVDCFRAGGKVMLCGNGGSAADSQHIAAEFMGRFKKERPAIPAIALSTNTSTITALANDYGYGVTFKRQLEGLGKRGDVAIGISTSGNSDNVYEALLSAKKMGLSIITMTGKDGGKIAGLADVALKVPSRDTPRIQESHITAGHIICELIEDELFG